MIKQNDLNKAFEIKKQLDNWKITSKEANKLMNNEFILLGWLKEIETNYY